MDHIKQKLAILLVSYAGDIEYARRLIQSYKKHNIDNIPMYIVVPRKEQELFEQFSGLNISILPEDDVSVNLVHVPINGIRPGYFNQEILKLSFWKMELCDNYFCVDSDGMFIRDFYIRDFMYDDETPYTILVEDNELAVDPEYYKQYWTERKRLIQLIQESVGLVDNRMLTCHGFAILSSKVLESMNNKFLIPNCLNYVDLLRISPYEFSWYNMWLQKDRIIPIQIREPLFKVFHNKNQHMEYLKRGITIQDISRGYIGIVVNSNYSRWYGMVSYENGNKYSFRMKLYHKIKSVLHFDKGV